MIRIDLNFRSIKEVTLHDIYGMTGVYVLWSSKAISVPSYIGEGKVLDRFSSHVGKKWAAWPLDGVIALLDGTPAAVKAHAELSEAVLLSLAAGVGRYPKHNKSNGKPDAALHKVRIRKDHDLKTIRFNFTGRDPLLEPSKPPMKNPKQITLRHDYDNMWVIDQNHWRSR